MNNNFFVSTLQKTWLFDLDGTLIKHHHEKIEFLGEVIVFLKKINEKGDLIVITSSRPEVQRKAIIKAFENVGIRIYALILGLPYGERLLVNDIKPSGLNTAYAINVKRDSGEICSLKLLEEL